MPISPILKAKLL